MVNKIPPPGAHLDGDGDQLSLLVQVEKTQRCRHVRLLSVDHVGRDVVQNRVVQQVKVSFLSHDRTSSYSSWIKHTDGSSQQLEVRGQHAHLELPMEGGAFR